VFDETDLFFMSWAVAITAAWSFIHKAILHPMTLFSSKSFTTGVESMVADVVGGECGFTIVFCFLV
jgi:hypothetical protein